VGALAENGAWPVPGQLSAVTVHPDHPVEHQVQIRTHLALLNERIAGLKGGEAGLAGAVHKPHRQDPLKRALHCGN